MRKRTKIKIEIINFKHLNLTNLDSHPLDLVLVQWTLFFFSLSLQQGAPTSAQTCVDMFIGIGTLEIQPHIICSQDVLLISFIAKHGFKFYEIDSVMLSMTHQSFIVTFRGSLVIILILCSVGGV